VRAFEDDRLIINMPVWASIESLREYVYSSGHTEPLRRRQEWFEVIEGPATVLWWVPAGHIPIAVEVREALDRLRCDGPKATAFTFKESFPSPGVGTDIDPIHMGDSK